MSTNPPALKWVCKPFNLLSPSELYSILRLRSEVFCVEQNCVYLDADNKDQFAWHLMGWHGEALVAYSRGLPPGVTFVEASIGRVVASPALRRTGVGKELMKLSVEKISELFGNLPIRIGAQLYLKKFYQSFGFVQAGEIYLEDGIEHIEMLRSSSLGTTVQDPA